MIKSLWRVAMNRFNQKQFNKFIKKLYYFIFQFYHIYLLGIIFVVFHVFYKVPYTISFFTIVESSYALYTLSLGSLKTSYIFSEKTRDAFHKIYVNDLFRQIRICLDILAFSLLILGYYKIYPYNNENIFCVLYFAPIISSYYYFKLLRSLYVVFGSNLLFCSVLFVSKVSFLNLESIFFSQLFIFVFLIFVLEYYRTQNFLPKITALKDMLKLHNQFTLILSNLQEEGLSALRNPNTTSTELDYLLRQLADVMQFSMVALFLIEKNKLVLRAANGYPSNLINEAFYEKGEGLTGMVWEKEDSVMLRDAIQHPRRKGKYSKYIEAEQDAKVLHFLGVPIKNDREIIGVITAVRVKKYTERRVYSFDKGDQEFIKTISLLIAHFYEKEKNKKILAQIYEISKKINGITDYGEILKEIVKAPSKFMDIYLCSILIKEDVHFLVKEVWCQNEDHMKIYNKTKRHSISEAISYEALRDKQPKVFHNINSSKSHLCKRKVAHKIGLQTLLSIPLFQGDDEIGVLNIFTNKPHKFSQSEIENATLFADQLVHAIQFNEGKLRALSNILRITQLINLPTEPDEIYDAILKSAFNLTGANVGAIVLVDRIKNITTCKFNKGFLEKYKIKDVSGDLQQISCPAIKEDRASVYKHEKAKKGCVNCSFPEMKELCHRYCIPIRSNNENIGNLFLGCMDERKVVNLSIPFFDIFTEQIGIVVSRTQTYMEMKALNEIGKELLAEHTQLYDKTVKIIGDKIECRNCALFVKSLEGFKMVASIGYPKELDGQVYKSGDGLTGTVAKECKTIKSDNIYEDNRFSGRNQKLLPRTETSTATSFFGTPIFDKHKNVIGIITLTKEKFSKKSNIPAFIDKHEQFLEALASMAAIAIENAEYAKEIEINTKNETERKSRESLEWIVRSIAHELQNPLLNIELYIKVLLNKIWEDDEVYSMFKSIQESIKQSQAVVKNLSILARLEKIKTKYYSISEVVSELLQRNRKLYERKNIYCDTDFQIKNDKCFIDVPFLKHVITNILKNAEEAVPVNNGTIDISTFKDKGRIGLKIEDNGPGFPRESFDSIFNLHYSTKKNGSGIGLPLSKIIIEKMGGAIKVGNNKDGGAVVFILMPKKGDSNE